MARNTFTAKSFQNAEQLSDKSFDWFHSQGYEMAEFDNGHFQVITGTSTALIYYSLKERPDYKTYYKASYGSSLLVFEVKINDNDTTFDCYTPLLLFGVLRFELTFKEKASWITKYRREGYTDMMAFKDFLDAEYD